uniref:Uncharacterized protein n=1 Tax=Parascaris univalens TaxID=6257 RepID=A0A915AZ50_PARUN
MLYLSVSSQHLHKSDCQSQCHGISLMMLIISDINNILLLRDDCLFTSMVALKKRIY